MRRDCVNGRKTGRKLEMLMAKDWRGVSRVGDVVMSRESC